MLHKLTALLLLIIVAGSSFNKAIVLIDYSMNKSYIAAQLCEKRNISKSCCQGKCFLKKQLQKEESSKNGPASSKDDQGIQWFWEEETNNNNNSTNGVLLFPQYKMKLSTILLPSVFHPPGQLA